MDLTKITTLRKATKHMTSSQIEKMEARLSEIREQRLQQEVAERNSMLEIESLKAQLLQKCQELGIGSEALINSMKSGKVRAHRATPAVFKPRVFVLPTGERHNYSGNGPYPSAVRAFRNEHGMDSVKVEYVDVA